MASRIVFHLEFRRQETLWGYGLAGSQVVLGLAILAKLLAGGGFVCPSYLRGLSYLSAAALIAAGGFNLWFTVWHARVFKGSRAVNP